MSGEKPTGDDERFTWQDGDVTVKKKREDDARRPDETWAQYYERVARTAR